MKRFWNNVGVEPREGGWQVTLDARPIKTQGGKPQILPTRDLADLLAAEFAGQGEKIDPKAFIFRDLADFAIDKVREDREAHLAKLLSYGETDTLCYRADPDEPLYRRQQEVWEPIVTACEAAHGIRLERASGIIHRKQSDAALAALRARLASEDDFTLAALVTLTSLGASLVVALAVLEDSAQTDALFAATNLEEDWQVELWGQDHEAEVARKAKLEAFRQAARFAEAVRG
ncbi:ATP12 family chaperone protein [Aurantiacibacter zhengii]|uniref:Molecular chaperone n=1 Tax=Aurantiacibacter zhengii TaxID=2307003 RepID=A0A418NVA9_9SPHN|nr:ATP12 family protein [Aurantiacibacter zhengii]RIV87920.1 molecular chaperone [Aurantiacibacter zhengii]